MSNQRARAALLELARHVRHRLEVERAHGGLRGLVPAPEEVRQTARDAHRARAKYAQGRAMRALRGPEGDATTPSRPSAPAVPATTPLRAPASSEETLIESPPTPFQSPEKRAAAPPPVADTPAGGALWKQFGSRPVSMFDKEAAKPTPRASSPTPRSRPTQRRQTPPAQQKQEASTPMMFAGMEEPTAMRSAPLAGFDGTAEERTTIAELSPQQRMDFLRSCLGDDCTRCKLSQGRKNIVFGDGHPSADLVFVGEAPGFHEDQQGLPFVGKAGGLLTKMIEAMGLSRDRVYICNTVKCRPPNNRDPEADELRQCSPFLYKQLESLQPQVIVTLGRKATHILLDTTRPMRVLRGQWQDWRGVAVLPTYHPAYLLRNPGDKRLVWRDLQVVMARMGLERPG